MTLSQALANVVQLHRRGGDPPPQPIPKKTIGKSSRGAGRPSSEQPPGVMGIHVPISSPNAVDRRSVPPRSPASNSPVRLRALCPMAGYRPELHFCAPYHQRPPAIGALRSTLPQRGLAGWSVRIVVGNG